MLVCMGACVVYAYMCSFSLRLAVIWVELHANVKYRMLMCLCTCVCVFVCTCICTCVSAHGYFCCAGLLRRVLEPFGKQRGVVDHDH